MTVGQVLAITGGGIAGLVAFIKGVEYLWVKLKRGATRMMQNALAPTNAKIDSLDRKISEVDLNQCKNFLVRFLADVEQDKPIDEVEKERFFETYQHYVASGGNSYIHDKVESLKRAGKL